jgi:hypothetical protein
VGGVNGQSLSSPYPSPLDQRQTPAATRCP